MIDQNEASKRIGGIESLELQLSIMQRDIYNRKANLLQTFYGFAMEEIDCNSIIKSYTDNIFTIDENVFCDIDEAMEYAASNLT